MAEPLPPMQVAQGSTLSTTKLKTNEKSFSFIEQILSGAALLLFNEQKQCKGLFGFAV